MMLNVTQEMIGNDDNTKITIKFIFYTIKNKIFKLLNYYLMKIKYLFTFISHI